MSDPKADFNEIVAKADSFYTNADSAEIESCPVSPKHFGHWYKYWRHRLDSNGQTRIKAFDAARDIYYDNDQCSTDPLIPRWNEVGPTEVAEGELGARGVGYVSETWIKPSNHNVMIIGTDGGGVFKTTDGGNSWTDLMAGWRIPGIRVEALEVNPDNEDHIYVSVGDKGYGIGILRTIDGGATWLGTELTKNPAINYEEGIASKIVANKPQYFEEAYAITKNKLFRTTDGFTLSGGNTVAIDSVDSTELEVGWLNLARNQSGNVFYSTNTTLKRYNETSGIITDLSNNLNWSHPNTASYDKLLICTADDRPNSIFVVQGRNVLHTQLVIDTVINGQTVQTTLNTILIYHVSLYISNDDGDNFTEVFDHGMIPFLPSGLKDDFAASLFDNSTFYLSGLVDGQKIWKNGNTWKFNQRWSQGDYTHLGNYAHVDVRDIDVLTNVGGWDEVFWSTDGGLFKSVYNSFDNLTEQDLSLWIVNGFLDNDGTGEIYCGVWHGGNNYRARDEKWKIRGGADGGEWARASMEPDMMIAGSNQYVTKHDRHGAMVSSQYVNVSGTESWYKYVAFPIEPKHSTLDSFYIGGTELYLYDWSDNQFVSTLTSNMNVQEIRDVVAHHSDGDIVVFANHPMASQDSALFKSLNGGSTWTDISTNLNVGAQINTIFMHPDDPNEIWVGMDAFISGEKVFVTYNSGATWTNVSDGLDDFPINDFAYDEVANVLYAASDFGVFYRDQSIQDDYWHCYFKDLPPAYVNQIDVNYCTKKLVAATAGRGFHHVDLYQLNEHTYATATWTDTTLAIGEEFYSKGSINISGTVYIKGSLYMHENTNINVPPGAKLIVDGGLISNSCGGLWGGIQAWGANHQNEPNQRSFSQSDLSKHGKVQVINGAIIENAETAILLGRVDLSFNKGGIVSAANSTFRNNYRSIRFLSYHNFMPVSPFTELNNSSSIVNCEFITEGALDDSQFTEPNAQVYLHDVKGIHLRGCTFADNTPWSSPDRTNNGNARIGIKSYDATFSVDPVCSLQQTNYVNNACWNQSGADSNTFFGYQQGISIENWNSISPATVRGARFDNNRHPFVLWGGDLAEIYKNDFVHSPPITTAALNLIGSTGYFVEENNFTSTGSNYGLIVGNSGGDANEIRNNYFESLGTATQYQGVNDAFGSTNGVQHLCNEMVATGRDVSVSGGDIALFQGSCAQTITGSNSTPANNTFSSTCNSVSHYDVYKPSSQWIYYAHLSGEQPICYSNKVVLDDCYDIRDETDAGVRCMLSVKINPTGHQNFIRDQRALIDDYNHTLDSISDTLHGRIENDEPSSTVVSALLAASPLLEDNILLMATSGKPTPLPDTSLLEILYTVAPLSDEVMANLEIRSHALAEAVNSYVAQNELIISPTVRSHLAYWQLERAVKYAQEEVLRYFLVYDSTGVGDDSALVFLQAQEGEFFRKKEFQLLLRKGDLTEADQLLTNIDQDYNNDQHLDEFIEWGSIGLELAADSAGSYLLLNDSTLEQRVRTLADTTLVGMLNYDARALLSLVFNEPQKVLPPIETEGGPMNKRGNGDRFFDEFEETNAEMLALYPNPASNSVTIEFELPESVENGRITVYTVDGKEVLSKPVNANKKHFEMDITALKGGVYIYLLDADGEFVARRRLIVSK